MPGRRDGVLMSVEAMAIVLHHSRAKGTAKVVLLGIANHDGDGGSWPSITTLAGYANVDERSAQRAVRQLEDLGEVSVRVQGGGDRSTRNDQRPNRYDVLVMCPEGCDRTKNHRVTEPVDNRSDGVTGVSPRGSNGVTLLTQRGDTGVANGVTPVSPEPSFNHPEPAAAGGGRVPVGKLPSGVTSLRAAFAARWGISQVSWTHLSREQADEIQSLVELHGVERLASVAEATKLPGGARWVQAFLDDWRDLTSTTTVAAAGPRCPDCGLMVDRCDAIAREQDPQDRCRGAEDRMDDICDSQSACIPDDRVLSSGPSARVTVLATTTDSGDPS